MKKPPQNHSSKLASRVTIEILETRLVLSASFDATGLTSLRSDPNFSNITGAGVTIAVLDTGIDAKNPDFSGKVLAYYNAVENAVPTSITSSSANNAVDNDGHGTHVSGIAASSDASIGVADGADLVDVKVIADNGESQLSGDPLLRGLEFVENFATRFNIKVVNMSLGESNQSGGVNDNSIPAADDISRAIQTLESMGITVVAAAGNSYANDPAPGESYPAVVSTISVANVWADQGSGYDFNTYSYGTPYDSWAAVESAAAVDQFSATSQRSTLANQVAAPGMDIYSDWNGSSTDNSGNDLLHNTLSGTSMAAPFVSGLVALMQQAAMVYGGQYITDPNEILTIIKATSDVISDPTITGDGRVPIRNGQLTGGAEQPLPGTGDSYDRVDVYKAIQQVKALFTGTTSNADTNDTINSATVVTSLNGTQSFSESGNIGSDGLNNVGANDVDLYKITLNETGTLSAALADANGGTVFTASLRLFDSAGNQLDILTGTSSNNYPSLTTADPLAAGTYFIGISSAGNNGYDITDGSNATGGSSTGDYTFTVGISNPDPNGVPQGAVAVDLTNPNFVFSGGQLNNQVANEYVGDLGSDPAPDGSSNRVPVPDGDVDMFKIVAPDTGLLTAYVDAQAYAFQGADSYVAVFDSNFHQISSDGQPSFFASDSQVQFNVTIGQTYYVAVTADANSGFNPVNPYGRAANSTATDTYYNLYLIFNNGNTDGTALLAQQGVTGQAVSGSIASNSGTMGANGGFKYVDWYAYTVNSTGLFDLDAVSNTAGFTPNVQLWTLTSDASSITEIGAVTGSGSPLIDQLFAGETVYVSVTGAGNSNFNWYSLASGTGGQTGSYTLNSSLLSLSQLSSLSDSSVNNGAPLTIAPGQTVTGNIGQDNGLIVGNTDVDLYKFIPTTSGSYDVRTDTSQEGSADTLLRVFNASGNQVASNDNASSATTASFIRFTFQAGQTYYIGVSGSGNSAYNPITGKSAAAGSTGTYVLSLSASSVAPATSTLTFSSHHPALYTDANHHRVLVTLVGPGSGQVVFDGSDLNADQITLSGSTDHSSLLIDVTHSQTTTVGGIQVSGDLNALDAPHITLSGNLTIPGSVKKISAYSSVPGFAATIGGNLGTLSVTSDLAGNFSAGSITKLKVRGNLSAAEINLTNTTGIDLNSLQVGGAINASGIFSAASINSIRAAVLNDSEIYAGVVSDASGLPVSTSDFATNASISSVAITGSHHQYAVIDSNIAAANLRKITFGSVNIDNGGTPFGLAADQLASFSRIIGRRRLTWRAAEGLSNLTDNADLTENIFG